MAEPTPTPPPERLAPAIGLLLVVIAGSSLLDDTELLPHPWWVTLALGVTVSAVALAARTVAKLVRSP